MKCPKCGGKKWVKAGFILGRQRYKCKFCKRRCTRFTSRGKSNSLKRKALHLYVEGMALRAIARVLGVSNVSVLRWIRKAGKLIEQLHLNETRLRTKVKTMELDELMTYIKSKKTDLGLVCL